jgi:predicted  nucleic acid-binding Zn-ribbon protein
MEKDEQIKETETEIAQLKAELIVCTNAIKKCKDSEESKRLLEEKEEIQGDIDDAENDLKILNEIVEETEPEPTEPTEELKQVNNQ